jgi:hypothetical protein
MRRQFFAGVLAAAAMLAGGVPALAQGHAQSCFYPNQWTSWKAPNDHTIFLKVGARIFRLDTGSCPGLLTGGTLITRNQSTQLCSAIDWDLRVRSGGITSGCIVSNMTQLNPDQAAALPTNARP